MANLLKKTKTEVVPKEADPSVFGLRRAIDDVFNRFLHGFELEPLWGSQARWPGLAAFSPKIDITDDENELLVTAEIAGLEEKDITVSVVDDVLTIKGEKKEESEEKKSKGYYRMERSYGSFQRTIVLPDGLDHNKAVAELKNGLLTVRFPKLPEAKAKRKDIEIKTG